MHGDDTQKQCDILIGEAILELLGEKTPITCASLLQKLEGFLSREVEAWRKTAVRCAITELTAADLRNSRIYTNTADALSDLITSKKITVH